VGDAAIAATIGVTRSTGPLLLAGAIACGPEPTNELRMNTGG
jgi:hypothetical protein